MSTEKKKKTVHVAGVMSVHWTVELPVGREHEGQACDDPAVEAALCAVQDQCGIHLWGKDESPAEVTLEVCEGDVEVEEDDRCSS